MIFPEKHIKNSESLIGIGSIIIEQIKKKPKNIDELWVNIEKLKGKKYSSTLSFDTFILSVDFLFIINAIKLNTKGEFEIETN